jgi:hypothetical protein
MLIKPLDFCVIIPALAAVSGSFFFAYGGASAQSGVTIKGEAAEWVFPLDADETVTVSGPLGDTIIEIRDNRARVLSSPCVNQTCVAAGAIDSPGQWAACLPNKVLLTIAPAPNSRSPDIRDVDAAAW